jgi:4-amino-4-deoxy-L-arabinose transferase-like glycosyltransferase
LSEAPTHGTTRSLPRALSVAILVAVGCALYLPNFAGRQLQGEEGRRAIPAREMLESGDYVLPTIWGRPYLNKPPAYFWCVAGFATLTGSVDEASTRLPSVVATLLSALLVYGFGRGAFGERAGLLAGLSFLVTLAILGKGTLGEIEAVFVLASFGCTVLLWHAHRGSLAARLGAAPLVAAALLLKGPAAFVFVAGAALGIAASGAGWRALVAPRLWLPVALGTGLAGIWVWMLFQQPGADPALTVWREQLARADHTTLARYLEDRGRYLGFLGGFLPSSLLIPLALGTPSWRGLWRHPVARFAAVALAAELLFFLFAVGSRPRYAAPAIPMACLLAGAWLDAALASGDRVALRRLRACCGAALAAGALAALVGLAIPLHRIGGIEHLHLPGVLLLAALLSVSLAGLRHAGIRPPRPALLHVFLGIILVRVFAQVELLPQVTGDRPDVALARRLESEIPEGRGAWTRVEAHYNMFFYLRRPIRWLEPIDDAAPGDFVFVEPRERSRGERLPGKRTEELRRVRLERDRTVLLLRVQPANDSGAPERPPPSLQGAAAADAGAGTGNVSPRASTAPSGRTSMGGTPGIGRPVR